MAIGFRKRDYILIGIEILDMILREFNDPGGLVGASYKNMYGFVPDRYKRRSFDKLLGRLSKDGYIKKEKENNSKYYSLTDKGKVLLRKKKFIFSSNKKWDKKFWIVIFDIEEVYKTKRNKLREIIKTFGFSMWQKSVWACPYEPISDFYEYLKEDGLLSFVCVFTIPQTAIGDLEQFAKKVWNIDQIELFYRNWVNQAIIFLEFKKNGEEGYEKEKSRLLKKFYEIILKDPFLPEEFLPENWVGIKARECFLKLATPSI